MNHYIRKADLKDENLIRELYCAVAEASQGLARRPEEVTSDFVSALLRSSTTHGLIMVLENAESRQIDGIIHATFGEIEDLRHVMGNLTVLVRPRLQGQRLGKTLFMTFLEGIRRDFPFIYRVELRARSSNFSALGLYESLGFIREGFFRSRIRNREGGFEDGIPMVWFNPDWNDPSTRTEYPQRDHLIQRDRDLSSFWFFRVSCGAQGVVSIRVGA